MNSRTDGGKQLVAAMPVLGLLCAALLMLGLGVLIFCAAEAGPARMEHKSF